MRPRFRLFSVTTNTVAKRMSPYPEEKIDDGIYRPWCDFSGSWL